MFDHRHRRTNLNRRHLPSPFLVFLLAAIPSRTNAQSPSSDTPALIPSTAFLMPLASSTLPTPTDTANYASTPTESHNVVNYYFLLLAIAIILIALFIYFLSRRRKNQATLQQDTRQNALARDVASWPGAWRLGFGRGRSRREGDERVEEGFNESGEAPPAYVKEPERAYEGGRGFELRGLEGKPPDYEGARRVDPRPV